MVLVRNLPHLVTAGRGLCGPVVLALLLADEGRAAFWVFVCAALTDLFDGWAARRLGSDPRIGLVLDVGADRVLGLCGWIGLLLVGWAPPWLPLGILVRDASVVAGWVAARRAGRKYAPSALGQVATSFEGASLGILLFHGPWLDVHWPSVGAAVGVSALLASLASAVAYALHPPPPA